MGFSNRARTRKEAREKKLSTKTLEPQEIQAAQQRPSDLRVREPEGLKVISSGSNV